MTIRSLLPPILFLSAIALAVVAFGMLAFGSPDIGVELHQARATNDELFKETLESDLAYRQWMHYGQIAMLFACSVISVAIGFRAMK